MADEFEYDVFLSFASKDTEYVRTIYQVLISSSLRVFWSDETLKEKLGNEGWEEVIEKSLITSQHFLLFSSTEAMDSYWVKQEYRAFVNLCHSKDSNNRMFFILPIHGYSTKQLPAFLQNKQVAQSISDIIPKLGGVNFKKLLAENDKLKKQLQAEQKDIELTRAQQATEFAAITRENQTLRHKVDALTVEIGKQVGNGEEYQQLKQEHLELTNQLADYQTLIDEANNRHQIHTKAINEHQQKYDEKSKEATELNRKLSDTRERLETIERVLTTGGNYKTSSFITLYALVATLTLFLSSYYEYTLFEILHKINPESQEENVTSFDQSHQRSEVESKKIEEDTWAFPVNKTIALRDIPSKAGNIINNAKWMRGFLVTDSKSVSSSIWYQLSDVDKKGNPIVQGWALERELLLNKKALKVNGVYQKVIPEYRSPGMSNLNIDKGFKIVKFYEAPSESSRTRNIAFQSFGIYYVYKTHFNLPENKEYLLIGHSPSIVRNWEAKDTVIGWVNSSKVLKWNTRLAAEYVTNNREKRQPARFLKTYEEWKKVIDGEIKINQTEPIAIENMNKDKINYLTPRFPIISLRNDYKSRNIWHVGNVLNHLEPEINEPGVLLTKGWVTRFDLDNNEPTFKIVVLMHKEEVEQLITLLNRLIGVNLNNMQIEWEKIIKKVINKKLNLKVEDSVAKIMQTHMGFLASSPILNKSFEELDRLSSAEKILEIRKLRIKLIRLRAVSIEKEIKITPINNLGQVDYKIIGDKKYWFGSKNNQKAWLDIATYMP